MTTVFNHLTATNGKPVFSLEVIPPIKGDTLKNLLDVIEPLMEFKPTFIDVTYQREEYIERPMPDGTIQRIMTRKRPGTVGLRSAIMHPGSIPFRASCVAVFHAKRPRLPDRSALPRY